MMIIIMMIYRDDDNTPERAPLLINNKDISPGIYLFIHLVIPLFIHPFTYSSFQLYLLSFAH